MSSFLKMFDIPSLVSRTSSVMLFSLSLSVVASIRISPWVHCSKRHPVRSIHGDIRTYRDVLTNLPCPPDKRILKECDAVLISSSHSYEDASLIRLKSWFKSLPQDPLLSYAIGPLLPPGYGCYSTESSESEKNQVERDIEVFLQEMQSKYGEESIIFVGSFPYHLTNTSDIHVNFSDLFRNQLLAYSA